MELRNGCLGNDGGKWHEGKVFEIDHAAFEEWGAGFGK
jgi:hypothetical protein